MKWVYIAIGLIVFMYVGRTIEEYVSIFRGDIQIIHSGVQP